MQLRCMESNGTRLTQTFAVGSTKYNCIQFLVVFIFKNKPNCRVIIFENKLDFVVFLSIFAKTFTNNMVQSSLTIAEALGLSNEDKLLIRCIQLCADNTHISEILNKLICSELNTKELTYCAFVVGKIQSDEKFVESAMELMVLQRINETLNK